VILRVIDDDECVPETLDKGAVSTYDANEIGKRLDTVIAQLKQSAFRIKI
jgi:hypothetical protein